MKPLLLATLVAFFIGGAIGAILPNLISSHTTASLNSSVGSPIEADLDLTRVSELEKENEALSQKLKSLQKELDRVNHNLASINTENVVQNPEPTEAQVRELKKKWIETILSQDDPRFAKRVERENEPDDPNPWAHPGSSDRAGIVDGETGSTTAVDDGTFAGTYL